MDSLKGFLAFNISNANTTSYYFDGWKAENGTVYSIDDLAAATSDLAGDDTTIQFTGVWQEIAPLTEEQLADAENTLPLDVFVNLDSDNLLITQSTDTLDKENDSISYTVSTGFNGDLLKKDGGVPFKGSDFATFNIIVNVDKNLEFANKNEDGTVTLTMKSNLIIPKTIQTTDGSASWAGSEGNWTVTIDPADLPSGEGGLQLVIGADFTDENYTVFSDKMTLTGLDFKLKDDAYDSYGVAPEVKTSANMTARIDLRNMAGPEGFANTRFRFMVLRDLLSKDDATGGAWRDYFGGGVDNPTAYVHALQFVDHKLADYDLSADATASLQANTCIANSEDAKTSYPGLEKWIINGNAELEEDTAAAGDQITFKLESNVPEDLLNYINPEPAKDPVTDEGVSLLSETERGSYVLVFHDEMDPALTNPQNFVVKLGEAEIDDKYYNINIGPDKGLIDSCTFEVTIDLAAMYADGKITNDDIQNATAITVTYEATLTEDATAGEYLNTAWVSYPEDQHSEKDTVTVKTFDIEIFKYDQATDEGLEGAEFELYQKDKDDNILKDDEGKEIKTILTSDPDGIAAIRGLDAGTYYLKETQAPDGYVCSSEELCIVIPGDAGDDYIVKVSFANSPVPHTGGTGTMMYTIGGIAIIVLAGVLLVVYRKTRKKQDR